VWAVVLGRVAHGVHAAPERVARAVRPARERVVDPAEEHRGGGGGWREVRGCRQGRVRVWEKGEMMGDLKVGCASRMCRSRCREEVAGSSLVVSSRDFGRVW
jgi:hypothetical protein